MNEIQSLIKAIDFAAGKHRDQRRKDVDATPYINHPIELASLLMEHAGTSDLSVIIAAILHDTLEDTETTADEIEAHFGAEIRAIVMEVTDDKSLHWQQRRQRQIDGAAFSSYQARLVKLADKICNLRDMSDRPPATWSLQRRREYYEWAAQVVNELRGTHAGLEALFDEVYSRKP